MNFPRLMIYSIPSYIQHLKVIGIAASHKYEFSEELSAAIEQALPKATEIVVDLLKQNIIIQ